MRFARLAPLAALTVSFLALLWSAEAQPLPVKAARFGLLAGASPAFDPSTPDGRALLAGLQTHGYVVGQNLTIEFRSALGQVNPDPFPALAAELVGLGVDLIVTTTEPGVRAARNASGTIPIVMAGVLHRPGGLRTRCQSGAPGRHRHRSDPRGLGRQAGAVTSRRDPWPPVGRRLPRGTLTIHSSRYGSVRPRLRQASSDWRSIPCRFWGKTLVPGSKPFRPWSSAASTR
jgi:hypothetical protein